METVRSDLLVRGKAATKKTGWRRWCSSKHRGGNSEGHDKSSTEWKTGPVSFTCSSRLTWSMASLSSCSHLAIQRTPAREILLTTTVPKLGWYDSTSSWEAYLFQFNLVVAAAKWTDSQTAASLATALEGLASQARLDISHRGTVSYAEMVAALQQW